MSSEIALSSNMFGDRCCVSRREEKREERGGGEGRGGEGRGGKEGKTFGHAHCRGFNQPQY